jgi:hypothetical protein
MILMLSLFELLGLPRVRAKSAELSSDERADP